MAIAVRSYSEDKVKRWDRFVWQSNNGTLFHTRRFLSYHPQDRFIDNSLIFQDKESIVAVLPAAEKRVVKKKVLVSHPGASFGGFVYKKNLSIHTAFEMVNVLLEYACENRFQGIELTIPPVIYHKQPNVYLDFALYKNGFGYKKREVSSIIPLDFSREQILDQFKQEARTAYRKSLKSGIYVKLTEDFDSFYEILKTNLSLRHNVTPTHSLDELKRLKSLLAGRINLFGAYLKKEMIAGIVNFICNDRVILAFYISHDERFQSYRPVNLLFYETIRWGLENNFSFIDFGIFTVNENPNWSLGKFKESFGARGIFRDTFYREI